MKVSDLALAATVILLLFADFLAFHDLFETHTAKDWLVLAASVLALVSLAGGSAVRSRLVGRPG